MRKDTQNSTEIDPKPFKLMALENIQLSQETDETDTPINILKGEVFGVATIERALQICNTNSAWNGKPLAKQLEA